MKRRSLEKILGLGATAALLTGCTIDQKGQQLNPVGGPIKPSTLQTAVDVREAERDGWVDQGAELQARMDAVAGVPMPTDGYSAQTFRFTDAMARHGDAYATLAQELDNLSPALDITVIDEADKQVHTVVDAGFGSSFASKKAGTGLFLVHDTLGYSPSHVVPESIRYDFPDHEHHFVGARVLSSSPEGLNVSIKRHTGLNLDGILTMRRDDDMTVENADEAVYTRRSSNNAGIVYTGVATVGNALLGGVVPAAIGFGVSAGQFLLNDAFDVTTDRAIRYTTPEADGTIADFIERDADHYAGMNKPITHMYAVRTAGGATVLMYASSNPEISRSHVTQNDGAAWTISNDEKGPEVFILPLIARYESSSSSNGGSNPGGDGISGGPGDGGLGGTGR